MNELYTKEVVKQAMKNGVPQEKIAAVLQRASQIANRQVKTASRKVDIIDSLLTETGFNKTASSVSYAHGIMNEALVNGANIPQAIQFTKQALEGTSKRIAFMEKVSAIAKDPRLSQYAEGFIGMAKQAGLSQDEAVSLLVEVVDREKRAAGDDGMFKQPSPDGAPPAPDGDPAAGAPPGAGDPMSDPGAAAGAPPPGGDPSGGMGGPGASDPQEAQILQMLQSLPPEEQQQIIQQLLAAISGGQGGPGGPGGPPPPPGAGAPPPGAGGPPPGAGGPPPGGPQGPA